MHLEEEQQDGRSAASMQNRIEHRPAGNTNTWNSNSRYRDRSQENGRNGGENSAYSEGQGRRRGRNRDMRRNNMNYQQYNN